MRAWKTRFTVPLIAWCAGAMLWGCKELSRPQADASSSEAPTGAQDSEVEAASPDAPPNSQSRGITGEARGDAAMPSDASQANNLDARESCRLSSDCVIVNWGCCENACDDGLAFVAAVNRASAPSVTRVLDLGPCGKVCSSIKSCGFDLSTTCERGLCVVTCTGDCPSQTPTAMPGMAPTAPP